MHAGPDIYRVCRHFYLVLAHDIMSMTFTALFEISTEKIFFWTHANMPAFAMDANDAQSLRRFADLKIRHSGCPRTR